MLLSRHIISTVVHLYFGTEGRGRGRAEAEAGGSTSRIPGNRDILAIPAKKPDVVPRPLQRQPLVPEPMVTRGLVGGGRVELEFGAVQETEDVEAVGGHDDDGLHGGFAD